MGGLVHKGVPNMCTPVPHPRFPLTNAQAASWRAQRGQTHCITCQGKGQVQCPQCKVWCNGWGWESPCNGACVWMPRSTSSSSTTSTFRLSLCRARGWDLVHGNPPTPFSMLPTRSPAWCREARPMTWSGAPATAARAVRVGACADAKSVAGRGEEGPQRKNPEPCLGEGLGANPCRP